MLTHTENKAQNDPEKETVRESPNSGGNSLVSGLGEHIVLGLGHMAKIIITIFCVNSPNF